jgi:hypothetical protein
MKRCPLRDLIITKPKPETTLSLVPAFRRQAREMVETYIFTDTIRAHYAEVLESVSRGAGQGFWVQAEYGAGKTHFLVVLAALVSDTSQELWDLVRDDEVRNLRRFVEGARLFPVVLSLRGEAGADDLLERNLLHVLLESGFERSLVESGLDDHVRVTTAEDILDWFENRASPGIRKEAEELAVARTGRSIEDHRDEEGALAAAELVSQYLDSAAIRPEVAVGVKARLEHIYDQVTAPEGPGYDGLLVVIDEYEGWEAAHNTEEELKRDAELLETLAWVLPRDRGCRIHTVVASQSSVPAKLRGGQEGDRFISLPLLSQKSEHDYDIIVSRRVRDLNDQKGPEIAEQYEYYRQNFTFAQNLAEEEFRDIFPFQPRCFEAVRRITARDLATARSGIMVFWEAITDADLMERDLLIRVADLLVSKHLEEDCLGADVYKDAHNAYRRAVELISTLVQAEDADLAHDTLTTLLMWYLAFMEQPRRLDLKELAEATLTTDEYLRADDNVAYVLDKLRTLPQIEFDNESAVFVPAGGEGENVVSVFNAFKHRALADRYSLQARWSESLFYTPRETGGPAGLFSEFNPDEKATKRVQVRNLEYAGDVVVATSWRLDHGMILPKDDVHFRLVFLTPSAAQSVKAEDLQDSRIAVVLPAEMTDQARDAAADHLAWQQMHEDYRDRAGSDAEEVRSWLDGRRHGILSTLVGTHVALYQSGRIITKDDLGIGAREAIGQPGSTDRKIQYIVEQLLTAAYSQLPLETDRLRAALTGGEVGKLFRGYFHREPTGADTAATRNYGVALGLAHPDQPARFSPQQVRVFDLIRDMLASKDAAELPVWQIYDRLSAPPYGLPYSVIQFMLLALVRHGSPDRLDLLLKPGHSLADVSRQPISRDRLTPSTVVNLEWKPRLEKHFDALVPGVGPTWNDALGYAREIVDDLRATTDQADIEGQSARLVTGLERLKGDVDSRRTNLNVLAGTLQAELPQETSAALAALERLTEDGDFSGYVDFYERAEEVFERSPDALRAAMQTFTRLGQLTANAAEIAQVKRYLDDIHLRDGDRELSLDRMTLLEQLNLGNLAAEPTQWNRLRADYESFKGRYLNAYRKHHRDYYEEVAQVHNTLADVPRQLDALDLLNGIERLMPRLGEDLRGRHQTLSERLRVCDLTNVAEVMVDREPQCDKCHLRLTTTAPAAEVAAFNLDLEASLAGKQRQLASEAVTRVLKGGGPDLDTFLKAVHAADLAALVDIMSPELASFIEELLAREKVVTMDTNILAKLAQFHPSVEETEIDNVVATLRRLLKEAFSSAKEGKPNGGAIRLNLRDVGPEE